MTVAYDEAHGPRDAAVLKEFQFPFPNQPPAPEVASFTARPVTNDTPGDQPPNNAPAFTEGDTATRSFPENTAAGANIEGAVAATDADSDTLTYSLGGTDASSFTIVPGTGQIQTGSGPYDFEAKSSYSVTVTVRDGNGGSDSIAVTINVQDVNEAPPAPSLTDQTATVGTAFSYQFAAVTDPDSDTVGYTAQLRSGAAGSYTYGSLPSWLTLTENTRTFSCDSSGADACVAGTYVIRVTASDGQTPPLTASADFTLTVSAAAVDYDSDNDGLIEVDSLAKLNAIRYDLDGDGAVDDGSDPNTANTAAANYAAAFPDPAASPCDDPNTGDTTEACDGYELTADLDFDTNGSGGANAGDDYWNGGAGWHPIGASASGFAAVFDGNGNVIAGLFIDRSNTDEIGLFGHADSGARIRRVGLENVDISAQGEIGALVGELDGGSVEFSYATGGSDGQRGPHRRAGRVELGRHDQDELRPG